MHLTLGTNSKDANLTDLKTPWRWHPKSVETCSRLCTYCVHISVHV